MFVIEAIEFLQTSASAPDPMGYICLPIWAALGIVGFPTGLYFTERKLNQKRTERTEARLDSILDRANGIGRVPPKDDASAAG